MSSKLQVIINYLILSVPLFLITGPFFSDLAVSLVAVLFLFFIYKNKLWFYFKNKFVVILFFFFLYIFLRSFISDIEYNLNNSIKIFFYFRFIIFAIAINYIFHNYKRFKKQLFYIFLFIYIVLTLDGLSEYYFNINLLGNHIGQDNRIGSLFGDELVYGSYLSRFLPIFIGLYLLVNDNEQNKKSNIFFFILLLFIGLAIFVSGERVAILNLLIIFFYLFFMFKNKKRNYLILFIMFLTSVTIILSQNTFLKKRYLDNFFSSVVKTKNNFFHETSDKNEDTIYSLLFKISLNANKENILFGHGPKTFYYLCNKKEFFKYNHKFSNPSKVCSSHPHNTYFQILAEIGFIGLLFYLILFLYIIYISIFHLIQKNNNKNTFYLSDFKVCILCSILITTWPITMNGNFFNNWLSIIYFYPIGFILNESKFFKSTKKNI